MTAEQQPGRKRRSLRSELLHRYVDLQRELMEADPDSPSYGSTVQLFRQLGCSLISQGFEDDLDRLLRLRMLDGGRAVPAPREEREIPEGLCVLDRRIL